jgi:hypothetical protein
MKSLVALLLSTVCGYALTCQQAWNYAYCAYPPLVVSAFQGNTIGDQIAACLAALPSVGGICDARDMPPSGTIPAMTITQSGTTILGPCGQYVVTGQILLNANTVKWLGCGEDFGTTGTRFMWAGNATDAMFQLTGSRNVDFEHFSIWSDTPAPLASGIGQSPGSSGTTTNNVFRDLIIYSNRPGGLGIGMRWYGVGGNNDESLVERVVVSNYTTAAYSIENSQSKSHLFVHSECVGAKGVSQYCVTTALGAASGSFAAINMLGGNNAVDFYLGAPDDTINIIGGDFEGSGRLLQTSATGTGWPIKVDGVRWSADSINADQRAVIFGERGGFTFSNNLIEPGPAGSTPFIDLEPSAPGGNAIAFGNVIFWNPAAAQSQPFTGGGGNGVNWTLFANTVTDSQADTFSIPNAISGGVAACAGQSLAVKNGIITQC